MKRVCDYLGPKLDVPEEYVASLSGTSKTAGQQGLFPIRKVSSTTSRRMNSEYLKATACTDIMAGSHKLILPLPQAM